MNPDMIPVTPDYWLLNARLPDGSGADIHVSHGRIGAIAPPGTHAVGTDLAGRQVWPCFVDGHTHLDKGHIWQRAPNPDGSFPAALATVAADRARWTEEDVRRRMTFALHAAFAHGTAAIRTHLDSNHPHAAGSWRVFQAMRDEWAGRVALQAASICPLETYDGADGAALADRVADAGGVMGGVTRLGGAFEAPLPPDFQSQLDRLFQLATERGLDIDLHVDESGEPGARALLEIARTAIRTGFRHRIQCGHCCSLSVQPDAFARETIGAVAEAGIAIVSLPMCNLYLQDRVPGRTPRWRGVTLVHELRAAGVPVSIASDNTADPFYQYGDLDMLEVFREGTRILHLDHSPDWSACVGATPAGVMGVEHGTLRVGGPADMVLFTARHRHELLARPQSDRIVIRAGRAIAATPLPFGAL